MKTKKTDWEYNPKDIRKQLGAYIPVDEKIGNRDFSTTEKKIRAMLWLIVVLLVGVILCREIVQTEIISAKAVPKHEYILMGHQIKK